MMQKAVAMHFHDNVSKIWKVFMTGVDSVHPKEIVKKFVKRDGEKLVIGNAEYDLKNNVYVIGFGKAVIGMVNPVENALKVSSNGSHLQKGILSVPVGIKEKFDLHSSSYSNNVIEYLEGAMNNIPDEDAFTASKRIVTLVQSLKEHDLLLVLISGGGSALLPYPAPPLTLCEKSAIIRSLSRCGANISELNTVRKALSVTKGGGIAQMTKAKVASLILSDVIGNSLDVIASGPTVVNRDPPEAAIQILQKYNIQITDKIYQTLESRTAPKKEFSHVTNNIIGSIETALSAIETFLTCNGDISSQALILSSSLHGEAAEVGAKMATLAAVLTNMIQGEQKDDPLCEKMLQELCIDIKKKSIIKNTVAKCQQQKCPVWLIFGGETTVTVTGTGQGGRNQEMVLSFSISIAKKMQESSFKGEVVFMSGGTDGIDGPTDAAGALTYWSSQNASTQSQVLEARNQELIPENFLQDNASYDYFSQLSSGKYLFKPGHTGTNVMDIQILFINPT
uniref:Glycerate kinase n=2 Tax=Scylla TaxID=6760 RepID=A0A0P4WI00_SCYOL